MESSRTSLRMLPMPMLDSSHSPPSTPSIIIKLIITTTHIIHNEQLHSVAPSHRCHLRHLTRIITTAMASLPTKVCLANCGTSTPSRVRGSGLFWESACFAVHSIGQMIRELNYTSFYTVAVYYPFNTALNSLFPLLGNYVIYNNSGDGSLRGEFRTNFARVMLY